MPLHTNNTCRLEHAVARMISSIGRNEMQAGFAAILTKLVQAQGVAASSNPPIFTSLLTDSDDLNKLLVLTLLRALYVSGTHEYPRASSVICIDAAVLCT